MRLLLDSHAVLWWLDDSPRLGAEAAATIALADEVFVSAATPWELGIKRSLGKIDMPDDLIDATTAAGFEHLSISPVHGETAARLPTHHRDPFDRVLIAQAQCEALTLMTSDSAIEAYDVDTIDAST